MRPGVLSFNPHRIEAHLQEQKRASAKSTTSPSAPAADERSAAAKNEFDHFSGQSYLPPTKIAESTTRKIPISEFKAHCTELLRSVENGEPPIQITRHGKVSGNLTKAEDTNPHSVAEWIGSGRGTATFSPDYDPEAPAFDFEDWEMHKE